VTDVAAKADALGERSHFALRRLHSLSGIVPVGAFLCVHLSVNASIMAGADAFQFAVDQIHKLNNLGILKPVEVLFIFAPIAFHAILGVIIWLSGRQNVLEYRYCGNLRYTLQRWTGIITLVFILVHLWHVHWIIPGGIEFDAHAAAASTVVAMQASWSAPVYAIGVLCAVFHLANGVWTFLITWGVTIGPRSQTASAWVCAGIGVALGLLGIAALITLETMDAPVSEPTALEQPHTAGPDHREALDA
jgi:succinate dehydrogenase / fumarate reductase cytochrome b subunit